jgi:hypothetical protein
VFWLALTGAHQLLGDENIQSDDLWEQIGSQARDSYMSSLHGAELRKVKRELSRAVRLLESSDTAKQAAGNELSSALLKRAYEHFSRRLYCTMKKVDPRTHVFTTDELALVAPHSDEALRVADFQKRVDGEIAYLDFDV